MKLSNLSIQIKLVLGAGLVFVTAAGGLIAGGLYLMYQTAGAEAEERARALLGQYSQLASGQMGNVVTHTLTTTAVIESLLESGADRDTLGAVMTNALMSRPAVVGMTLALQPNADGRDAQHIGHGYSDATGRMVPYFTQADGKVSVEQLDMSPEAGTEGWYDLPIREDRTILTPPYTYPIGGVDVLMTTISAVVHANGKPAGIVTSDLTLDTIAGVIGALKPFDTGAVLLVSNADTWIAHPDPALAGQPLESGISAALSDTARMEKGMTYVNETGENTFIITTPLTFAGVADQWTMVMTVPSATIYAGVDAMRNMALTAAGVLLLGVVGVVWFGAGLIARPIRRMTNLMGVLARGEYDVEVPHQSQKDEIGDMARAVEVFRENGLKVTQMTEEERAASQRRRIERTDMMVALQAAFGEVVDAAIAGDFTKRVHAQFPDAELNSLAGSVNSLVETVDRGLSATGSVLAALAEADLTQRMDGDFQGSFAKLKSDTNAVAEKLSDVIGQLRVTSRALKSATGEILAGANDLSERTTKQAATIEETSAAMEQLANTVAENARMADNANRAANAVSADAARSGEVIEKANEAMERITQSSAKISNIIGMIDDIAFQTNLLALNASVEAARAGEAGKGFAVVAVEVRRLAQSAAEASSEVKALIEASASEVRGGSHLVSSAAAQLRDMLGAVTENAGLMQAIAKASQAQATAIEEVSVAVRTLDEMTQHNAALVEETNAAIEQTEAQAGELDRVVDIFTLDDRHAGVPAASPAPSRHAPPINRASVQKASQAYLSRGNAAISADWDEF
jgi:methyl-accepting chemotaxis protein